VAAGLPTDAFLYLGYLPRKPNERRRFLAEVAELSFTLILLETPHRLLGALEDLKNVLGDRQVAVSRELTKLHEEIFRGRVSEALDYFSKQAPRGEFTLVIGGKLRVAERWPEERLRSVLEDYLARGESVAQLASQLSSDSGWPRREVYRLAMQLTDNQ
jgi:16S rRNA (cytidine1402-2'-O)-methyltransferase